MDRVSERVVEQMIAFRARKAQRQRDAAARARRRAAGVQARHAAKLGLEQRNGPASEDDRAV